MTAIPILNGIAGSETAEFLRTYPLNLEPVIIDSKLSKGQLRAAPGAKLLGTGPGADRGGILWNDQLHRVMGTKLCEVASDGTVTQVGDVGPGDRCWFDYSFDRLAIGSGTSMFYRDSTGLTQVTDVDLGSIIDGIWIDGYFMVTDGTYVLVTELADPTSIMPLKYGSAEEDPDPITGLLKYRDEPYIFGRYTVQVFSNVGGNGFPFADRKGAGIPFGCIGPKAKTLFGDGFAFVGSARDEALDVYAGGQGTAQPIGTREICDALAAVGDLNDIRLEARVSRAESRLLLHLPNETWVFMLKASSAAGEPIWYRAQGPSGRYGLRNAVEAYGGEIVADDQGRIGLLDYSDSRHFGEPVQWQFEAGLLSNSGFGGVIHSVELMGLPGRGYGETSIFLSMTRDGETYTTERALRTGQVGARLKRLQWRPHVKFSSWIGFRFRGSGMPGIASLEVKAAPLAA